MRYPLALLGLATQVPLQKNPIETHLKGMVDETPKFAFKEAPDIFSPKDLVCRCLPFRYKAYLILHIPRSNWDAPNKQLRTLLEIWHWFPTANIHSTTGSKLLQTSMI